MKDFAEFIRAITRPVLTIIWTTAYLFFVFSIYENGGDINDIPTLLTTITLGINIWWFGERLVKHMVYK